MALTMRKRNTTMTLTLQKQVDLLKVAFSVEGALLIKSDRFTDEQIKELKKKTTCHPSHWHLGRKVWSDKEIEDQIITMNTMNQVGERELTEKIESLMSSLPLENLDEKQQFKKDLYSFLGWTDKAPLDPKFWANFGSAPCSFDGTDTYNKNLVRYHREYGTVGMDVIFGDAFDKNYHVIHTANNALEGFAGMWNEKKKFKDIKNKMFSSPYESLDDLEENVTMKKIEEEARKFYMDKTKKFEDRLEVFNKYGKEESYIFRPNDKDLKVIFQVYSSEGYTERHEQIECSQIIEFWLSYMAENRIKIDWSNRFHPKMKELKRGYEPSEEAQDRLFRFYMERLFVEGVGSFNFDW